MKTSKDPELLSDTEWDAINVKKNPFPWKLYARGIFFLLLILTTLTLTALFVYGFIYGGVFTSFVTLKNTNPTPNQLIEEHIYDANVRVTARLLTRLNSERNTVWSPFIVGMGVGLLLEGTTEQTAYEIKSAMGWIGVDRCYIRSRVSSTMTRLNNLRHVDMTIANGMFFHNSFDVNAKYKNILSENYQATIDQVDFTTSEALESINRWGKEKSHGRINELIRQNAVEATTQMLLSSVLVFNGDWKMPFSPEHTQKSYFTTDKGETKKVDMMYQTGRFMYGEFPGHGFSALELPYSEPNISMIIILPRRLSVLKAILQEQDGRMLIDIRSKMKSTDLDICLPKFTIETEESIEDDLSFLGIRKLFSPAANLELISSKSELYVKKIIHRVKIQVTESGTLGQASSSSIMEGRSLFPSFYADHPFIFYVEDKKTNSILFWGEYKGVE